MDIKATDSIVRVISEINLSGLSGPTIILYRHKKQQTTRIKIEIVIIYSNISLTFISRFFTISVAVVPFAPE